MKVFLFLRKGIIFILLIFIACSTGRISISVLEPAKINIPSSIKRVSLFPGAGIPNPPGVMDSIHEIELEPDYDYNRIKRGYMHGVYETMSQSPRFHKVVLSDSIYESLLVTGMISWAEIRQICSHDSTDAIFLLKKAVSRDTLARYDVPGVYCGILYRVINNTKWTFYQPFLQREYEDLIYSDTSIFKQDDENCDGHTTLLDVQGILYDACFGTGTRLGEQISPTWHDNIPRVLFTGPGTKLQQASLLAMNDKWDDAAAVWNALAEGKKRRQASHAAYNMALAWEREDDLPQAVLWISYADSLLSSGKTLAYKKILEVRLKNRELLDLQMNCN
jgi:hypothetical protein